jgi:hypothetical protein
MPFLHAPSRATGETSDPACWFRHSLCYGVIPSLEALAGVHEESLDNSWSHGLHLLRARDSRERCTLMWHLFDDGGDGLVTSPAKSLANYVAPVAALREGGERSSGER